MDICHLKNAELETKCHQKYRDGVVLRGDIVKVYFESWMPISVIYENMELVRVLKIKSSQGRVVSFRG